MHRILRLLILLPVFALAACAGHHAHYAGMQAREIKVLSSDDIDGLRAGRGMRMALPAERNGYPGPLHVLALADRLQLSDVQRGQTQALYDRMRAEAVAAGEALIARERELDRLFAGRTATADAVTAALARVAEAQARVRGVHLLAHLGQVRILTAERVAQYNRLRGYGG